MYIILIQKQHNNRLFPFILQIKYYGNNEFIT